MCAAKTSAGIGSTVIMGFGRSTEFSHWNLRKTSCSVHSGRPLADPGRRQRIDFWTGLQPLGFPNLDGDGRSYSWLTNFANNAYCLLKISISEEL